MQNKKFDTKTLILVLIIIATIVAMFFIIKNQKTLISQFGNIQDVEGRVNIIKLNDAKMDKLLTESNELLKRDQGFLDNLKSYVDLPKTDEQVSGFIGEVKNKYPFGNPIQGESQ